VDVAELIALAGARFVRIVAEAAPFLLLGTFVSGLLDVILAHPGAPRFVPRQPVIAALIGGLAGLLFPVGDIGAVPVARRLLRHSLPAPAAIAFLLAAPILNPIVLAGTVAAFRATDPAVIALRAGCALAIAVPVGLLFALHPRPDRLPRPPRPPAASGIAADRPRLSHIVAVARAEFFELGRYLLVGALLAAVIGAILTQERLEALAAGPVREVLALEALAVVGSFGGVTDAFTAADLYPAYALGPILGFLVAGPLAGLPRAALLFGAFERRSAAYLLALPLLATTLVALWLRLNVSP